VTPPTPRAEAPAQLSPPVANPAALLAEARNSFTSLPLEASLAEFEGVCVSGLRNPGHAALLAQRNYQNLGAQGAHYSQDRGVMVVLGDVGPEDNRRPVCGVPVRTEDVRQVQQGIEAIIQQLKPVRVGFVEERRAQNIFLNPQLIGAYVAEMPTGVYFAFGVTKSEQTSSGVEGAFILSSRLEPSRSGG
jgi:hypothetical protein